MAKRNMTTLALTALFVLGLAAGALAGIPNSQNSPAFADNCGVVTIAPRGAEALGDNGHTINLTVRDINNDPVVGLLTTDMWVEHPDMAKCSPVWNMADTPTDANGDTTFSGLIWGGVVGDASDALNCDDMELFVYALGIMLNNDNPVCVTTNSPDLNGSLSVTLADFGKFAVDYNCAPADCDPCHDYNDDDSTTLADFTFFSSHYNSSVCP
jgi:hypothetical protein